MAPMSSAVYQSPGEDSPQVAIVFDLNGEVLAARVVPSVEAGRSFIKEASGTFGAKTGLKVTSAKID